MSSKSKKKKRIDSNKLKYARLESKKNYLRRIREVCEREGCGELFDLIPKSELEKIYALRESPFKVADSFTETVEEDVHKEISYVLKEEMQSEKCKISDAHELSLYEISTYWGSFLYYLENLKESRFENAKKVKELCFKFFGLEETLIDCDKKLNHLLFIIGYCYSSIKHIHWFTTESKMRKCLGVGIENKLTIHSYFPPKIEIIRDEEKRPAYKICLAQSQTGIESALLSKELFGCKCDTTKTSMEVYIQSHAIIRLSQRLDCVDESIIFFWLLTSLFEPHILKENDNKFLIEYGILGIRLGYLVADIDDNIVLIRTFLFLTQSGTPQGKKLNELYKLRKMDITYLEIDRLSTFVTTNFCENNELIEVFTQAGCRDLLEIYANRVLTGMCVTKNKHSVAGLMTKYLGLHEKKRFSSFYNDAPF